MKTRMKPGVRLGKDKKKAPYPDVFPERGLVMVVWSAVLTGLVGGLWDFIFPVRGNLTTFNLVGKRDQALPDNRGQDKDANQVGDRH